MPERLKSIKNPKFIPMEECPSELAEIAGDPAKSIHCGRQCQAGNEMHQICVASGDLEVAKLHQAMRHYCNAGCGDP